LSGQAYRLTPAADTDIEIILRQSQQMFGPTQQQRYAALIDEAARLVAAHPERPDSRPRDDLGSGIRTFHVGLAARRRGAASHVLYFRRAKDADSGHSVAVLRVLHEAMDPKRHLTGELR
jgi:toxin ParE1/3/4